MDAFFHVFEIDSATNVGNRASLLSRIDQNTHHHSFLVAIVHGQVIPPEIWLFPSANSIGMYFYSAYQPDFAFWQESACSDSTCSRCE